MTPLRVCKRSELRIGDKFNHDPERNNPLFLVISPNDPRNISEWIAPCWDLQHDCLSHTPVYTTCYVWESEPTVKWKPGMRVRINGVTFILVDTSTLTLMRRAGNKSGMPVVNLKNGKIRFLRPNTKWESDVKNPQPGDVIRVDGGECMVLAKRRAENGLADIAGVAAPETDGDLAVGWVLDLTPFLNIIDAE